MNRLRLNHLRKLAGRIKVEQYYPKIKEITDKITNFFETKKQLDIKPGQSRNLGSVIFNINGKNVPIVISIINDNQAFFAAGVELSATTTDSAKLTVNYDSFKLKDNIFNMLMPYVYHEITHFIDGEYQPSRQHKMNPSDYDLETKNLTGFYQEVVKLLSNTKTSIDFTNIDSFKGQSLERVVRIETIKLIKTPAFNELLKKYNLTMNPEVFGKIINVINNEYVGDMNFYLQTGGNPFAENQESKKNMENGKVVYYNTKTEIKAYINQIIQEIGSNFLYDTDGTKLLTEALRGKIPVSVYVNKCLEKSDTFKEVSKYLYPENLKFVIKEVAKYLLEKTEKKNYQNIAVKLFGEKLYPREEFVYRYLNKMHKNNPDKLLFLLKNPEFLEKNHKVLLVLKDQLKMFETLQKFTDDLNQLSNDMKTR